MSAPQARLPVSRLPASRLALTSGAAATLALGVALHFTAAPSEAQLQLRSLTQSPERVAEGFVLAYAAHDYDRAASLSSGALQTRLHAKARRTRQPLADATERSFSIEESYFLSEGRMRLQGNLTGRDASDGRLLVSVLVGRHEERFLVENVTWPAERVPENR